MRAPKPMANGTMANGTTGVSTDEDALTYIFQGAEATLYLSVDPQGYVFDPDKFSFTTGACYIYAETIIIPNKETSWTWKANGQTLGIFCNQLLFSGDNLATFDVSGVDGTENATTEESLDGNNSGDFYLYVEDIRDPAFNCLKILARGGNGGRGVSYPTDTVGGKGGNAGNGGNVRVVFGSEFHDLATAVHAKLEHPWPEQASAALGSVLPSISALSNSALRVGYDADDARNWSSIVSGYDAYAAALSGLVTWLKKVGGTPSRTGGHPSAATKQAAADLATKVTTVLESNKKFPTSPANTDDIKNLGNAIEEFMKKGGLTLEGKVTKMIKEFQDITISDISDLSTTLDEMKTVSLGLTKAIQTITSHDIVSTNKGTPGLGGNSGPTTIPVEGPQGDDGTDGDSSSQFLFYDGSPLDSTTSVPFAFPEQCRMLLNLADANYFTTETISWADAMTYYQRLVKRLSFLDAGDAVSSSNLDAGDAVSSSNLDAGGAVSSSNLGAALGHFVYPLGLTWNPLEELLSVYKTAQTRLSQITLGQDMFGHDEKWAPRLSPAFYRERATSMITDLATMEGAISTFTQKDQTAAIKLQQYHIGISNAKAGLESARDRIELISGKNGLLPTYEYQISITNPLIKPALKKVLDKLKVIEQELETAVSYNPEDILSSLSMLAMCPNVAMGVFEAGATWYKGATELADVDGVNVNRKLVIKKFETCGKTLKSLNEAYRQNTNTDGTVDPEDPTASFIISTQGNVDSLLQEFSNIIPESDSTGVDDAFNAYIDIVLKRNNYIMSYNSALQMLLQAIHDKKYYTDENNKWSQDLLKLNPDLPYIRFWLEKNRDDLRFQIMQKLNYEARANRFWGLGVSPVMAKPGPLQGTSDLRRAQRDIDSNFENCLEVYAGNQMNKWPARTDLSGPMFDLPDHVLYELQNSPVETTSSTAPGLVYTTSFTIAPGSVELLNGMANVRLSQVRLWLPGATTTGNRDPHGNQVLSIILTQSGEETIHDAFGEPYEFVHDPVSVEFQYLCNKVKGFEDCVTDNVWSLQELTGQYNGEGDVPDGSTINAPIGPYSEWKISITSNASLNPDLNLSNVKKACMEFCGRSQGGR